MPPSSRSGQRDVSPPCARRQMFHPSQNPSPSTSERGGAYPQPHQVEGPLKNRTCVLGAQQIFVMGQGAAPRAREEYPQAPDHLRVSKSVCGTAAPLGRDLGDVPLGTRSRPSDGGEPHEQVLGPLGAHRICPDDYSSKSFQSGNVT